jgi:hypothetical protein
MAKKAAATPDERFVEADRAIDSLMTLSAPPGEQAIRTARRLVRASGVRCSEVAVSSWVSGCGGIGIRLAWEYETVIVSPDGLGVGVFS